MKCRFSAKPINGIYVSKAINVLIISIIILHSELLSQNKWKGIPIYGISPRADINFKDNGDIFVIQNGSLIVGEDNGKTWSIIPIPYYLWKPTIAAISRDTILFTNAVGDLFRTIDGMKTINSFYPSGKTWNRAKLYYDDRIADQLWYIGDNIYKSTDAGSSWNRFIVKNHERDFIMSLAVSRYRKNVMMVVDNSEAHNWKISYYLSNDGGLSWSNHILMDERSTGDINEIAFTDSAIYAGFTYSPNYGVTWETTMNEIKEHAPQPCYPNFLKYAEYDSSVYVGFDYIGLFKIRNGKDKAEETNLSWLPFENPANWRNCNSIAINDNLQKAICNIDDSLFIQKENIFRCLQSDLFAIETHEVYTKNKTGDTMIIGTPNRVLQTTNGGESWQLLFNETSGIGKITKYIYGDPYHIIYTYIGGPITMYSIMEKRFYAIFPYQVYSIETDPLDQDILLMAGNGLYSSSEHDIISKLDKAKLDTLIRPGNWFGSIAISKCNRGNIYLSTLHNEVVRVSNYRDIIFKSSINTNTNSVINKLALSTKDENILYAVASDGFYISYDNGRSWINRNNGLMSKILTDIIVDDSDNVIYVSAINECDGSVTETTNCRGGVYYSTDSGNIWARMNDDGMDNWNVSKILLLEKPKRLIAGTQAGVYSVILDNNTEVSERLNSNLKDHRIEIYPNPIYGDGYISIKSQEVDAENMETEYTYRIYNVLGKIVKNVHNCVMSSNEIINIGRINTPGVYMIVITIKNNRKSTTYYRSISVVE
jgi:photosystem II stability/assembly factor-like uncharacterized protein